MVEKEVIPSQIPAGDDSPLQIRSGITVQEMEKALIFETLRATGNNRTEAARMLGISIRTLRNKLHEYRGDELPADDSM
jgi:DNA-binding NtrC family response regulator